MAADRVFCMQHVALSGGAYRQALTDLIFRDGIPIAVLRWGGSPDNEFPLVIQRLDQSKLKEFRSGRVEYLYDDPIEVPPLEPETPE
jgi:hypothetical protein